MKKTALVAAIVFAALGLSGPALADGWGNNYPPPGFAPPPSISLFSGNAPSAFYPPAPPRRHCVPPKRFYGYKPAYTYAPGYQTRYGRVNRGGRTVIIVTR